MTLAAHITRFIDIFYIKPVRKIIPRDTFRYAFCGAFVMALGWALYPAIYYWIVRERFLDLGFTVMSPHVLSLCMEFPVTFLTGFWLHRHVTFQVAHLRGAGQMLRYGISTLGSFVVKYLFIKLFVEVLSVEPSLSNIIAEPFVIAYSYLMGKYFTFNPNKGKKQ